MDNEIITGDVRETLPEMPESSVHMCMTSPPYFGTPIRRQAQMKSWSSGTRRDASCPDNLAKNISSAKANTGETKSHIGMKTGSAGSTSERDARLATSLQSLTVPRTISVTTSRNMRLNGEPSPRPANSKTGGYPARKTGCTGRRVLKTQIGKAASHQNVRRFIPAKNGLMPVSRSGNATTQRASGAIPTPTEQIKSFISTISSRFLLKNTVATPIIWSYCAKSVISGCIVQKTPKTDFSRCNVAGGVV